MDGVHYDLIATHDQGDAVTDVAVDPTGRLLGCTLLKDRCSDTAAKLLQIGRSKKRVGDGEDSETQDDDDGGSNEEDEEDEEDGPFPDELLDQSDSDSDSGVTIQNWH